VFHHSAAPKIDLPTPSWRTEAARIVEELFPVTPTETWNLLIDLRRELCDASDWNRALDLFLACREQLEADHYLPFYRLRRLLTASLRLETAAGHTGIEAASLAELLQRKHRSLADVKRAVLREIFEHSIDLPSHVSVRVVEQV
jgi:hypothetical protein